jgi:hypothetical protein
METILVIVIIAGAAGYTIRSLYRSASVGKKSCGCEDGCPISEKCRPQDSRCVMNEESEGVARSRGKLQVR